MRSADRQLHWRTPAAAACVLAAAGALAGCTTTQQKAARLQLEDARLRASQLSTRVSAASSTVAVTRIALVREPGRTAFVVTVRNRGGHPVSDLPISVGYRLGAAPAVYLNSAAGIGYFDAHLPLIRRGRTFTWIYATRRALPAGARPFARVGASPTVRVTGLDAPPAISAAVTSGPAGGEVRVSVRDLSGVTQYQLPVYAIASRGSRVLAAAAGTIAQLNGGASATLRLKLLGSADGAHLELETQPTTFQ